MRSLEQTEEIYAIGFSLSVFDAMARLHFAGVMCERAKGRKAAPRITLVDPYACCLQKDYQDVFGHQASIESIQKRAEDVDWKSLLGS
jgi:hypothetical protein